MFKTILANDIGGRDHFFFLLNAAAMLDVLIASNDDVRLNENRTVRFSSLRLSSPFEKINKFDWDLVSFAAVIRVSGEERCVTTLITAAKETNWDYSYWQMPSLVCPLGDESTVLAWRYGGHVSVPNQSSGSCTRFLCKRFLLFEQICIDAGHVSENLYAAKLSD